MSSSDLAIDIRGLGKSYEIDHARTRIPTFRDAIASRLRHPFRRKRLETFWALKEIDLQIRAGEVVGIIGRNGAGKSTLLKVLSRITEPTVGQVDLYGRVGSLLEVGTGFHPELTGRENIYLNGSILGMRRDEIRRQFDAIVDFAEVKKFLDTPVKRYSSGMYVRLAFAVAAHLEPEILIVDEVLAVGDAQFQNKCLGKMDEVARSGRTVLFVSHNMAAIRQLCSTAVLMRAGRVVAQGQAGDVMGKYFSDASIALDGRYDLKNHPARSPSHSAIIRSVAIQSDRFLEGRKLNPGGSLIVELELHAETRIAEPRIAVAIEDSYGRRITTVANYFGAKTAGELYGHALVSCRMAPLALGEGRYLLSVSVSDAFKGLLDSVDCAAWFDVGWDNNYGTGEAYHPVYGPVLRTAEWSAPQPIDGRSTEQRISSGRTAG